MLAALRLMVARVRGLIDRRSAEDDVDQEIYMHLAMLTERFMRQGMNEEEAQSAARRQFGGVTATKEELRQRRSFPLIEALLQDVRYGFRQLGKAPAFTAVAVSILALGVGTNTAIFSIVDAVLLRPLPYTDGGRLVWLGEVQKSDTTDEVTLTPDFLDWRSRNHVFTAMAAFNTAKRTLTGSGEPLSLSAAKASATLLPILDVQPLLGRNFRSDEDQKGHDNVAILSYGLWQQTFGANQDVVGKSIRVDDQLLIVVGVLPREFRFPSSEPVDILTPLGKNEAVESKRSAEMTIVRNVIARLKPGVSLEQARAEMELIESQLAPPSFMSAARITVSVISLRERFVGNVRAALIAVLCAVAFVLVLACANVANLLLSRAVTRQREMAIRSALGASRWRLATQLLVESLMLAALGCLGGLTLALWTRSVFVSLLPKSIPGLETLPLDLRVFAFAVVVAFVSAVVFGLGPALSTARSPVVESLISGGRSATGGVQRQRWLNLLASAQIAIAIVLLTGGGLVLESFWKLRYRDLGFQPNHLLTAHMQLSRARYPDSAKQIAFLDTMMDSVANLPGVEGVGVGNLPPGEGHATNGFGIEGRQQLPRGRRPVAQRYAVSVEYFRLLGIPLIEGRGFLESDNAAAAPVALISETFARRNFAGESSIGRRVRLESADAWRTIVGVVGDVKTAGLAAAPEAVIYFPYRQTGANGVDVILRSGRDPGAIAPGLRKTLARLDPQQPIAEISTMDLRLTESASRPRLAAVLLGSFAALGLILATVGLYGVMTFLVRWRFREIGIRLAIGAQPSDVTRMIFAHSFKVILGGVVVGVCGSLWLNRLIQTLLYGVSAADPLTFVLATGFLCLVGLSASYLPAREASGIDPITTLRSE